MKNQLFTLCFWVIAAITVSAQQSEFPKLTGPYLGQEKPGIKPELFATELISKYGNESQLLISPDGKQIYFTSVKNVDGKGKGMIYYTEMMNGYWTEPKIVSFSGIYCDGYIALHPDGTRMYFQSDRPIDPDESDFEWNIWYVDKVDGVWGIPKSIGRPINGRGDTGGPSVTTDGTMYFTLFTFGGSNTSTLYRSKYLDKIYQEPEKLPDMINKDKNQFDSYIAPDESYLIFSMYMQRGSHNDPDLFISFRDKDDHWSEVINLGPTINSLGIEGSATLTPDGKILAYSKANYELSNGWDIYWVDTKIIEDLRKETINIDR